MVPYLTVPYCTILKRINVFPIEFITKDFPICRHFSSTWKNLQVRMKDFEKRKLYNLPYPNM